MQIFVLGMHRSGTSVVTRLINLMGAYFGPEELSTGANPENPKGFWERRDVRDENDAVLWSSGADWWKVSDFAVKEVPTAAKRRFGRGITKIVRELDAHQPWVVKEPRLCLLLPMWRRYVENPVCVLVNRSPIQVAHSLHRRNQFPLEVGVALWERYVLDALAATADLPRVLVSYEEIMADPEGQVDRILGELANAGVEGLCRPSDKDISSFVSQELFHQRQPKEEQLGILNSDQLALASAMTSGAALQFDEVPALSARARRTLQLFEDVSDGRRIEQSKAGSANASPQGGSKETTKGPTADIATVRARAMKHLGESQDLRAELDQLSAERKAARKRATVGRREIEKLHVRLNETEKALDRARSTSKSRGRSLKLLKTDFESSLEEISRLQERSQSLEEFLVTARAEQEVLRSRLEELKTTLSESKTERKELDVLTAEQKQEIARIHKELDTSHDTHRKAVEKIEELSSRLEEVEAALERASSRASDAEATADFFEGEAAQWRSRATTAESRTNRLERSLEDLLVFLRRSQQNFESISRQRGKRIGPLEIRSHTRSAAARNRLRQLFGEIGKWVSSHRHELAAMIEPESEDTAVRPQVAVAAEPMSSGDLANLSIDVVVCIHNSLEEVRRCLESVIPTLGERHSLILVDDGSGRDTAGYLDRFAPGHDRVTLVRREEAGGYTKAANLGIEHSTADFVVLLNSDTRVPKNWLTKLARAAYQSPAVGIVGPLSNAASWQSVPEIIDENGRLAVNELPAGLTVEDMDRIATSLSPAQFPQVDLANGFCFGIKREVLDSIGRFDEEAFPKGYGEENDFCFRAVDAGFSVVIATDCYVYHEKSKSYSSEVRDRLAGESGKTLTKRYSTERIRRAVEECKTHPILVGIRQSFEEKINEAVALKSVEEDTDSSPRILFVLPVSGGGGGVHSIVQETTGIRELGAYASVAVPAKHIERFRSRYPSIDPSVFVGFRNTEDLIAQAARFDVAVATIFTSVKRVKQIVEAIPGIIPAYYIQDYEPWICADNETLRQEALASYELIPDMVRFAKTDWIRQTVEEKHGVEVYKVSPSLDTSIFFSRSENASGVEDSRPVRIAAMIRPKTPRRAAGTTMQVLEKVKKEYGERVAITTFGCGPGEDGFLTLSRDFEFDHLGVLLREEVADTLRNSDIFVDFSTYQAFGRTALEAMACGCAVIVPEKGGTSEYAEHEFNALVVDTADNDACTASTRRLVEEQGLRERLSNEGISTARRYGIRKAADSILSLLNTKSRRGVKMPATSG
jgi:GT2 family glycosyltransferase